MSSINSLLCMKAINSWDAQKLTDFLITKLNLHGWEIKTRVVDAKEIGDCKDACTRYTAMRSKAIIWLLSSESFNNRVEESDPQKSNNLGDFFPQDMVQSLVHEMLHIKFGSVGMDVQNGKLLPMQESVVDMLATLILSNMRECIRRGGSYDKQS